MYEGAFAPALKAKKNSYKEDEQLDIDASYFTASFADKSLLSRTELSIWLILRLIRRKGL
jgi:hypothetical protein